MAKPEILEKKGILQSVRDISYQQILHNMVDSSHDLEMKTRIPNPFAFAVFNLVIERWEQLGFTTPELGKKFIHNLEMFWVSKDGKRAEEVLKSASGLLNEERRLLTASEKMSANLRKL